ncbi:MAG: dihydrodipicolinate synthase family protein, partial [Kiloniellales bacterium]
CHGLAPFGTTSEGNSLAADERIRLLDALVETGVDAGRLIPGTGCCALTDTVILTRHALGVGCGGVLMLPPFYYKAISDDGLFACIAEVIERVGDARLRIYLYHIPPVAQVGYTLPLIERLVAAYPSVVVGIKDSSGDWNNTRQLLEALPGFGTFCGSEVFLLDTLRGGGVGCITATANVNATAIRRVYDAWQGDQADRLQQVITARRQMIQAYPMIPALKQIVAHYRDDAGWLNLRPPLTALTPAQAAALLAALDEDGFRLAA